MKKVFYAIAISAISVGCSTPNESTDDTKEKEVKAKPSTSAVCSYSYENANSTIAWTAFKFTEKVGVGGTFNTLTVSGTNSAENMFQVFEGLRFNIPVSSVNSNNPDRDMKIQKYFFANLSEMENLEGFFSNINENGEGMLSLVMNGRSQEVPVQLEARGDSVFLNTSIDVQMWDGMSGIEALNQVCEDLHKGADGLSVLWPNVDLSLSTKLNKECN